MTIDDLCINSSSFELNQAIPSGGIYSINDIDQNILMKELGVGSHLVNYYYKDLNTGCSNSISDLVEIFDHPKANISISPSITDSLKAGNIYFGSDSERAKYFYWYNDTTLFLNQKNFGMNMKELVSTQLIWLFMMILVVQTVLMVI